MNSNKRIAKNTLMLYFRMIIIMLVTLYTSRIILAVLGVEDFGLYNVVGSIIVLFGFLSAAMSSATQRFLSFELGKNDFIQLKKVFNIAVIIHFFIAFLILLLAETVGLWFLNTQLNISSERLNAANWVFHFSVLTFMVGVMSVPFIAAIVSHERMNIFAYVSILEVSLKLAIVFLLEYTNLDKLKIYACLVFMVSVMLNFIYQLYCRNNFEECRFSIVWDKEQVKKMASFSGWSLFGGIAYVAKAQGVNVILNVCYGVAINAAWGLSQQVGNAILSFIQNFTTAINPPITKAYANGNIDVFFTLLFGGMKYSFFLSFCLIVPLFLEIDYILSLWLRTIPEYTMIFIKMLIVSILIETSAQIVGIAVQATGKIKWYQILVGGLLFLNLPFSYFIIKITNEPSSVMYVAVFLSILSMIVRLCVLYRLVHFSIIKMMKLIGLFFLLPLFIFPYLLYYQYLSPSLLRVLLTIVCVIAISFLTLILFGMSKAEHQILYKRIFYIYSFVFRKNKTV